MTQQSLSSAEQASAATPAEQPLTRSSQKSREDEFKLERYKYILQEIHTLNENGHKYLALFQTLATFIVGGGTYLFVSWRSLHISPEVTKTSMQALVGLLVILTLFVLASLIGGIFSWLDYRKEEVKFLDAEIEPSFRKPPTFHNWWRWNETYIVLFVLLSVVCIIIFVETQILPQIR